MADLDVSQADACAKSVTGSDPDSELEKKSVKSELEVGSAFDADGKLLLEKTGTRARIKYTDAELDKVRGAESFTHNHPEIGGSFSRMPTSLAMVSSALRSGATR